MSTYTLTYTPTPTIRQFHNSVAPYKALAGPPGAGKTVGALWEFIFRAMRQPADNNGVRKFRIGAVRATYPNLKTTTVKTVNDWMPEGWGRITMGQPMEGRYTWPMPDGTRVYFEIIFLALDREEDLTKLRSLEVSGMWLNEATELERATFSMAVQRIGRYPSPKDGVVCQEPGVVMDFNLPGMEHWLYDVCVRNPVEGMELFTQPPAVFCTNFEAADAGEEPPQFIMNPDAENLTNLPDKYYERQLATADSWGMIKSFLLMKWSTFITGKIVYTDFKRSAHVGSVRTEPLPGETVFIGIDTSGLHPAAIIGQLQAGSLVLLDELYGDDMAFQPFIEEGLLPLIAARYANMDLLAVCDPSNPRNALTGHTPTQILASYGIRAVTASTNSFKPRREAVSWFLARRGGMMIDPACEITIKAFEEKYVYRKLRLTSTTGTMYSSDPEKNYWSHIMDAVQYLCTYLRRPGAQGGVYDGTTDFRGKIRPRRLL